MGREWGEPRATPEERAREARWLGPFVVIGNLLLWGGLIAQLLGFFSRHP